MWYIRGGRGGGKTWTGAHQLAEWIIETPGSEWAIVAPTFADARDVGMEGPSGLLKALGLSRSQWNRSHGELFLPEGGRVYCDGADDGALRIQGKNLAGLWADEVGLWRDWRTAWDESIAFAVRKAPAKIIATGTPKRGHPLVKRLMDDITVVKTVVRTLDNAANLSDIALTELLRRYEGTTLGQQELEGVVLTDVAGSLWNRGMIVYGDAPAVPRDGVMAPDYERIVIAIDPAGSYGPDSDETGIVAVARNGENAYVLADVSGRYSPGGWASKGMHLYTDLKADAIVAETNFGGDMVEGTLRSQGFDGHFIKVTASRGKMVRAEGPVGLYEKGHVFHLRPFPELEDQMCTYTGSPGESPDRLDALVWALTELMLGNEVHGDYSMIA